MGTEARRRKGRVWSRCVCRLACLLSTRSRTLTDIWNSDDTQIEQPDTPAPIFAVRALKTALFGTPAPKSYQASDAADAIPSQNIPAKGASDTPSKPVPAGILLTPGTGTTRRKRVSFDHDVKAGANGIIDEEAALTVDGRDKQTRPRTRLTQALENSRKNKKPQQDRKPESSEPKDLDDVWEEVDEDRDPDVTVDLNEPHSRSGKYWKSCFESYHADAKAEMEKLVKYKQLAKSYAKMKDSEAMDLQQKLAQEQDRVKNMEMNLDDLARQVNAGRSKGGKGSKKDSELVAELAKQTALAMEYREQVEELEHILDTAGQEPDADKKKRRKAEVTSPRSALVETNRQLRRARLQQKELNDVKDEVSQLKAELQAERQKSGKLADENRKLATDLSRSSAKIIDLEKKLDESIREARTKEREFRRLKTEHDQLKENAKSRFSEAEQVLAKKNETIAGLKDEIRSLKTERSKTRAYDEERNARRETLYEKGTKYDTRSNKPVPEDTATEKPEARRQTLTERASKYGKPSLVIAPEENTIKWVDSLGTRQLGVPQLSSKIHVDKEARHKENQRLHSYEDQDLLVSSRALRDRITSDMGKNGSSSSVLSDRANLQETRRPEPSSRHSYPSKEQAEPSLPTLPRIPMGEDDYAVPRKSSRTSLRRKALEIRPSSAGSEEPQIDLAHSHFARLGDTVNTSTAWDISTAKTSLPAKRRAAAIARLQRKKADRARAERTEGRDKENMAFV